MSASCARAGMYESGLSLRPASGSLLIQSTISRGGMWSLASLVYTFWSDWPGNPARHHVFISHVLKAGSDSHATGLMIRLQV